MGAMSTPRLQRAFWGDARFAIGLALVALSVGGVWLLLSSADGTTPVLQAARTLTPGEAVTAEDFAVVEVGLGALTDDYLEPHELGHGAVVSRTITEGELVPVGATTTADDRRTTTVVIGSTTGLPQSVEAGSVVELWQAPALDDGRHHDAPRLLLTDVVVREVVEGDGVLAEETAEVELVIERGDVADVLGAVTSGAALSVVPVGSAR